MTTKHIVLIDGNSLAYRAFYALPDTMRTTTGITTNAIYGFTTMLIKVLDSQPDFVAIAFDRPEPTFRHTEYKEYKATRQKAPPTLHEQMPYVKEVAAAFGIPIYELAGYEGDDIIGTLAVEAGKKGYDVTILTGDLDPLQLVNDQIKVLATRKGITDTVLYGPKEVEARYDGLKPEQLIDYKALKGDSSDNIPGVPKVGEKTAVELLKEYKTLEGVYANLEKIKKPALQENLKNNRSLADLSRRLGTIVTNAPIHIDFEQSRRAPVDWEKVLPVFNKFEFGTLYKKYSQGLVNYQPEKVMERKREEIAKFNFTCVKDEPTLEQMIKTLGQAEAFAFDVETTSLNTFEAELVGISFSCESKQAYYLPLGHGLALRPTLEILKPLFLSNKLKIGHNLKYDIEVMNNHGIEVAGPLFDTMVAAYLIDPTSGKLGLKILAKQFLGREMIELMELIGKDGKYAGFAEVPVEIATDYAASDAEATFGLYEIFKLALKGQKLESLFNEVEMPLLAVLIKMEETGVKIDAGLLAEQAAEIEKELKELEQHIHAIAGEVFNINSTKQLAQILFTKLMLPVIKKGKTGPSTDFEVLEELAARKFEIAEKLIDYRQLTKLKNTYIDVLPTLVNARTGRIHSSFNQTITATGRLSSSDPNLQNIPARGDWGKRLRSVFIPEKTDRLILAADYSQIELRVLAHLSSDPVLLEAFNQGTDIHQRTADELGISRADAKTVNFGIIYGISDFGLAKQLKVKRPEAAGIIERYFAKHQGVKAFIDKTIKEAKENGYVTTMLGRKRPVPDINSPNAGLRSATERMAINTPVQGSAADLIKLAMITTNQQLTTHNLKAKMIMQVHDELVFECPAEEADTVKKIVVQEMENAVKLSVPVKVDIGAGKNWAEAKG
ncbi:MAG: DNA polymerase I [Candidatus Margulisbacteria bacterium]|nr:DNA polymerase I [Candidatus Margulisiibacteriota bacterium]MBU1616270.1 DNA polymerase I [Candidatus Margulisiibacteriota bacterium]